MLRHRLWRVNAAMRPLLQNARGASEQANKSASSIRPPALEIPSSRLRVYFDRFSRVGPLRALYLVSSVFLTVHITNRYFYSFRATEGISMLPTLNSSGDWVLISKYYRRGRGIQVGDLVSYSHPSRVGVQAVKRVVGLEGDFVDMGPQYVHDDRKTMLGSKEGTMVQVPSGHCWVVGDNLKHSRDSRMFGPLPLALIKGKITARYAGLFDMNWIRNGLQDANNDLD